MKINSNTDFFFYETLKTKLIHNHSKFQPIFQNHKEQML